MPITTFLIAWANAPFTVVLGTVLLFIVLGITGVLGLIAGDHGGDDGGDDVDGADADGHDVEGHEADHDGGDADDADHDADHEDHADRGAASHVLAPLGIGKLPFSIIWQVYGAIFALTGLLLNARYVESAAGPPLVSLAWTMPLALSAGYAAVALVARVMTPIVADEKQLATRRADLVGHVGTVISSKVDASFGEVRIRDKTGHDLRVVCRLAKGHAEVKEGEEVVVVEHENGWLYVAGLEEGLKSESESESETESGSMEPEGRHVSR